MNIKELTVELNLIRTKEREYSLLAQQSFGAIQILEHLIAKEKVKDAAKEKEKVKMSAENDTVKS